MIHTVKSGDSLYAIGREHGISYTKIAADNELSLDRHLVIGQTIFIDDDTEKVGEIVVNGYAFPNITPNVLYRTLPQLTYISVFSYECVDGLPKPLDDGNVLAETKFSDVVPVMVVTNIGDSGGFEPAVAHEVISSDSASVTFLDAAIAIMKEKGYKVLNVDFEYIYQEDKESYNNFIMIAEQKLHDEGFELFTALAPKYSADQPGILYSAHDYNFHGRHADRVILMTYEWGYTYSEPMAVAPISEIKRVLDYAVTEIPSEKILMGIPNYGYDWFLPYRSGRPAVSISNYNAVTTAWKYGAEIEYDERAQAPHFDYYDEANNPHVVYFEDARSIEAKLKLVSEYNLGGVSYWTINRYFPQNWLVLDSMFDVEKKAGRD
ncbi:MAG: LysM peptidoglycan-binding domain-containing protein [Clostridiales bacterium]|jgi:spore germination protein|nr:LysM peptidoglycan-binding domain-containing protein [Clostridiales bacterium]